MADKTTLASIDRSIQKIKGIAGNINQMVQDTAVAIIQHGKEHGDVTRALVLVQALPSTMRREMLVNWFGYYGPIGMNTKEGKVKLIDPKSNRWRQFDVDGAKANPWFVAESVPANMRPEPIPDTMLEFGTNIVRFAERMRKKAEDPKLFQEQHKAEAMALIDQIEALAKKSLKGADIFRLEQELAAAREDLTPYGKVNERRPQTGEITSQTVGEKVGKAMAPEGQGAEVQHENVADTTSKRRPRNSAKAA